ncbi:MAG: IS256 family transposase [Calditrichaeota bacterium]|nr:IS256 family transposase [Calditrichota bacterium]
MTQQQSTQLLAEVQKVLLDDPDFLRSLLSHCLQKVLDEEFTHFIGAEKYERSEERRGHRNGSYERSLKTRVGTIELSVCRDREGLFQTELFGRYQRNERALVTTMVEMYVKGVSTRKVGKIVEALCGSEVSKSQISELTKGLDESLTAWRKRRLDGEYPYLVVDARYEKVRTPAGVVSKAVLIIIGISNSGKRSILAVETGNSESEECWGEVFRELKERGLKGLIYVVSDQHRGLVNALNRYFQGVVWQRCQVHFIRNFMSKLKWKDLDNYLPDLKEIFAAPKREEAMRRKNEFVLKLEKHYPEIAEWIDENIEFSLAVYALPPSHRKRMKSTNMIERLNKELKRRSKVIGIFPNDAACLRVLGSICQETSEEWEVGKKYLNMGIDYPESEAESIKLSQAG